MITLVGLFLRVLKIFSTSADVGAQFNTRLVGVVVSLYIPSDDDDDDDDDDISDDDDDDDDYLAFLLWHWFQHQ